MLINVCRLLISHSAIQPVNYCSYILVILPLEVQYLFTVCGDCCIITPLELSGHYMYQQFNIHKFYVLPTQCIYVFCVDLRTNSDYFPIQH